VTEEEYNEIKAMEMHLYPLLIDMMLGKEPNKEVANRLISDVSTTIKSPGALHFFNDLMKIFI